MGCCGNKIPAGRMKNFTAGEVEKKLAEHGNFGQIINNMRLAAKTQRNLLKWLADGVLGLLKCATDTVIYTPEETIKHLTICTECEFSTKDASGGLTPESQCLATDPVTGEVCGCFIVCKTRVSKCPINKWPVALTVDGHPLGV